MAWVCKVVRTHKTRHGITYISLNIFIKTPVGDTRNISKGFYSDSTKSLQLGPNPVCLILSRRRDTILYKRDTISFRRDSISYRRDISFCETSRCRKKVYKYNFQNCFSTKMLKYYVCIILSRLCNTLNVIEGNISEKTLF